MNCQKLVVLGVSCMFEFFLMTLYNIILLTFNIYFLFKHPIYTPYSNTKLVFIEHVPSMIGHMFYSLRCYRQKLHVQLYQWDVFQPLKIQVVMKEKDQCVAHHVWLGVSLTHHAASTSPVESMNSNIKYTMGCSSNMNTSTSLLKMAKGSNRRITMFDNEAQRALQTTSLASKLIIKDTILKQCLHICNQNFDKRKYYKCVQCSEDDWMVWNFYYDPSKIKDNIADMVPKFLNVFHVCLKRLLGIPFFRCDCLLYDR